MRIGTSSTRAIVTTIARHPIATVFLSALGIRVLVASVTNLLSSGVVIPDERQYLTLAMMASTGKLTDDFWFGYGQSLFDASRTFLWPLTAIFWLVGPSRFAAQLLPIMFGAATAATTVVIADQFLRRPYALLAGFIVAFFPSQVLWSSVVLRESQVWIALAGMAVVLVHSHGPVSVGRIINSTLLVGVIFFCLSYLRQQTALLAIWSAIPALLLGQGNRGIRAISAVCLLLVAPWLAGLGPGGATLGGESIVRIGTTHAYMSMTASSSFVAGGDSSSVVAGGDSSSVVAGVDSFQRMSSEECTTRVSLKDSTTGPLPINKRETSMYSCIIDYQGRAILADNRLFSSISRIPRGIINTMIRPFPWEARRDFFVSTAALESGLWWALYTLSGIGLYSNRQNLRKIIFPLLIIGLLVLSGAVTHGNLGTAFRHRGQGLFIFAVFAAGGIQAIVDKYDCWRQCRGVISLTPTST